MTGVRKTIAIMRELSTAEHECPLAPPEHATVESRTVHRACLILGGIDQLSRHLGVPVEDLRRWLRAGEPPPEPVLLACVEIVLLYAERGGRAN